MGDAKDPVRKGVRVLFGQLCCIYPPGKLFPYVVDGLKSKNSRQRSGTVLCVYTYNALKLLYLGRHSSLGFTLGGILGINLVHVLHMYIL